MRLDEDHTVILPHPVIVHIENSYVPYHKGTGNDRLMFRNMTDGQYGPRLFAPKKPMMKIACPASHTRPSTTVKHPLSVSLPRISTPSLSTGILDLSFKKPQQLARVLWVLIFILVLYC